MSNFLKNLPPIPQVCALCGEDNPHRNEGFYVCTPCFHARSGRPMQPVREAV